MIRRAVSACVRVVRAHPNLVALAIFATTVGFLYHGQQDQIDRIDRVDHRTTPYAPLTHRDTQVLDRMSGVEGPAIVRGGTVHVSLTFCNSLTTTAHALSSLSWVALQPDGEELVGQAQTVYSGIPRTRAPGCVPATVPLVMPITAQEIDVALDLAGTPHRWQVIAAVTPLRDDGSFGTPDRVITPPFTVVP